MADHKAQKSMKQRLLAHLQNLATKLNHEVRSQVFEVGKQTLLHPLRRIIISHSLSRG
jgi:hypothetical protein